MAAFFNLFKNKQEREKNEIYDLMYSYFNEKKINYTIEEPDVVKLNFTSRNNITFEMSFRYLSDIEGLYIYSVLPLWFKEEEEGRLLSFVNQLNHKVDIPLIYETNRHTVICRDLMIIDKTIFYKHIFEVYFTRHYRASSGWLGALEAFKNGELNEEIFERAFMNNI